MLATPRSIAHVQRSAPEWKQGGRAPLKPTNDSWRVDERSIKVRGPWMDLYRAVAAAGSTIDFVRSPYRHAGAAVYFFRKALGQPHTVAPRGINVDKNPAYPVAVAA